MAQQQTYSQHPELYRFVGAVRGVVGFRYGRGVHSCHSATGGGDWDVPRFLVGTRANGWVPGFDGIARYHLGVRYHGPRWHRPLPQDNQSRVVGNQARGCSVDRGGSRVFCPLCFRFFGTALSVYLDVLQHAGLDRRGHHCGIRDGETSTIQGSRTGTGAWRRG